jgi:2-keto-4-pentenoate hydratase
MTPQTLLRHLDEGQLWPDEALAGISADVGVAYQTALQVRQLREARDVHPRGFKTGFSNCKSWERYQVFEPSLWLCRFVP